MTCHWVPRPHLPAATRGARASASMPAPPAQALLEHTQRYACDKVAALDYYLCDEAMAGLSCSWVCSCHAAEADVTTFRNENFR